MAAGFTDDVTIRSPRSSPVDRLTHRWQAPPTGFVLACLTFVLILGELRLAMFDMPPARFHAVWGYVGYLFVGPFLLGRIARAWWAESESDWSFEFLWTWTFGLMCESLVWLIAWKSGVSALAVMVTVASVGFLALGRRCLSVFVMPPVRVNDVIGLITSVVGLSYWIAYRFLRVPAVDEQVGRWGGFTDYQDLLFQWAYAAQFKTFHVGDLPQVVGLPMQYVFATHLHLGLASLISGADLELVLLRGFPVAANVIVCLGLAATAHRFVPGRFAGVVAVLAFYFANSLSGIWQPDSLDFFGNLLRFSLPLSPTLLFSLPLFLAAFHAAVKLAESASETRGTAPTWIALCAVMVLGALAKAPFAVVMALGLIPSAILICFQSRRAAIALGTAGFAAIAIFFVTHPFVSAMYSPESALRWMPFSFFNAIQAHKGLVQKWPQATAAIWMWPWVPFAAFCFSPIAATAVAHMVYRARWTLQTPVLVLMGTFVIVPLALTALVAPLAETFYLQAYSVTVAPVLFVTMWHRVGLEPRRIQRLFWRTAYVGCLLATLVAAVRSIESAPVNRQYFRERYDPRPLVSGQQIAAWRFIAAQPDRTAVVASNFHEAPFREATKVRFWYQSALTEREHFLEGWSGFSSTSYALAFEPEIQKRLTMLARVFSGDFDAVNELKRTYGVRYLVDNRDWALASGRSEMLPAAWKVFSNSASSVYRIP